MRFQWIAIFLLVAVAASAQSPAKTPARAAAAPHSGTAPAASAASPALARKIENYLRKLYAWGSKVTVKVGAPVETPIAGLQQVPVVVTFGSESNAGQVFVSADGRYIVQGEMSDMTADPFVPIREKIHLDDAPSEGPADSRIVVVEYGDFQCPSCRAYQQALRAIKPNYPQVRFVFRDFPLTQIHAWAMSASLGGRCVQRQNPAAFWTYYDAIYDAQDSIKPENAWDKIMEQSAALGLDQAAFKGCMIAPETKALVARSMAEGVDLKIANTPTVFVNGRRLVGGDRETLEQFIQFELAATERKP
jgi:protein-disulfide isomerase